jgi:murein DD-endopeptidase MepM/ murein hydrolase activator NlpD
VDIHTKAGVPVVAADGGTVTLVSWQNYGYGYHVIIAHADGTETLYAHLSAISVEAGQTVAAGQEVGLVGSTGRSTGPHLHFEVRTNGVQTNPFAYLP